VYEYVELSVIRQEMHRDQYWVSVEVISNLGALIYEIHSKVVQVQYKFHNYLL